MSGARTRTSVDTPISPIEILPRPVGSLEERERRLIEAVVAFARSLEGERDRLAARLGEVEPELSRLASRLDARPDAAELIDSLSVRATVVRAASPRIPSRTSG